MSDKSLETLKVVIEGDAKQLKEEMKNVRKEFQDSTKEVKAQQNAIKKAMDEQLAPIRKLKEQLNKIREAHQKAFNVQTSSGSMKNMEKSIESTEKKLKKLINTRNELESTGGDIEYTNEYKEIAKAVENAEKKLNGLIERQEKLRATGASENTTSWKRLQYDIEQADNSLKAMKADMDSLSTAEKYQNSSKYAKVSEEISRTRSELAQLSAQQYEYVKASERSGKATSSYKKMQSVLKGVTSEIKKVSGAFAALIQKFKTGIPHFGKVQKSMNGMGQTGRGLGGIFQTIGMTARFMFASFLIYGTLQQAAKGLQNLAQYSNTYGTQFNKSMSAMYSGLKQLQNALATAFEPIINVVAPYITKFVSYLTDGANALAQFFSALTGSNTWTRATYNTQNYADSLDDATSSAKALNRELYSFDEINKQSDSSSSSAGGLSAGSMFTTETVNNQFADIAKMVKDAWSKADFTEIGGIVGTKLKNALDGMDWTEIKKSCKGVAKSVGTFINGFIGTDGLDKSIGKTIGETINTGVGTANTFFKTVKFTNLGEFIASTANRAIQTTHFDLIGETVANGLAAGIDTWYGFVTTFNFDNLGTKIGESLKSFFTTMNQVRDSGLTGWQELGVSIGKTISGMSDTLVKAFEAIPWADVKKGFKDLLTKALSNMDINVAKVLVTIAAFKLSEIGFSLAATALKTAIASKLASAFGTTAAGGAAVAGGTSIATVAIPITAVIVASVSGWNIGKNLGKLLFPDDSEYYDNFKLFGKNGFFDDVKYFFTDILGSGSNNSSVNVSVTTDSKKSASNLYAGVQGELNKLGPFSKETITPTKGLSIFDQLQKDFSKNSFTTTAKTSTTGTDLRKTLQSKFGLASLFTVAKTTNSGNSIRKTLQSTFGLKSLSTTATVSNSGNSLRAGLQPGFGLKSLLTSASVTNSGDLLRSGLQPGFGAQNLSTGVSLPDGGNAFDSFNSQWNSRTPTLFADLKVGIGKNLNGVNSLSQSTLDLLINGRANGGIFSGGTWKPVAAYASGGTPASAQLFMAREAGPELVGTIGNHTAVVNNDQIVSSVASGVYRAVASAMMAANANSNQSSGQPIYVYVGGKQITDYVVQDVNNRTLATGQCPIKV